MEVTGPVHGGRSSVAPLQPLARTDPGAPLISAPGEVGAGPTFGAGGLAVLPSDAALPPREDSSCAHSSVGATFKPVLFIAAWG